MNPQIDQIMMSFFYFCLCGFNRYGVSFSTVGISGATQYKKPTFYWSWKASSNIKQLLRLGEIHQLLNYVLRSAILADLFLLVSSKDSPRICSYIMTTHHSAANLQARQLILNYVQNINWNGQALCKHVHAMLGQPEILCSAPTTISIMECMR